MASLAASLLAIPIVITDGFFSRFPAKDQYLLSVNPTELGRYTERRFRALEGRRFDPAGPQLRVAIIGDSYAQDIANMIGENGYLKSAQIVTYGLAARCPKYIGTADVARLYALDVERLDAEYCRSQSNLRDAIPLMRAADVVILASQWRAWEAERIGETLEALGLAPSQTLVVVGRKDFGPVAPMAYLEMSEAQRREFENAVPAGNALVNDALRKVLPAGTFVDMQPMLCAGRGRCRIFTPAGELLTFDGEHFTPEGARRAGALVFEHPVLARLK